MRKLPLRFDAEQAQNYSGATQRQLRYWDQTGLCSPSVQGTNGRAGVRRLYSRSDVLRLCAIVDLLQSESLQRIRRPDGLERLGRRMERLMATERWERENTEAARLLRHGR